MAEPNLEASKWSGPAAETRRPATGPPGGPGTGLLPGRNGLWPPRRSALRPPAPGNATADQARPGPNATARKTKLLLICPAARQFRVSGRRKRALLRMKVFRFSMLTPLCVAASAPDYVQTQIVDESVEPIDFDCDADVVGISFMTFNAPRAYEIADAFRRRGKTVIFGGYHPTLAPQEAIQHCDAICIGEAEANLPRMMEDFRRGRLQRFYRYRNTELRPLAIDTRLIDGKRYLTSSVVQATRGCPNGCGFCSVSAFYERSLKCKQVSDVVAEIRAMKSRNVLFIDDNIAANLKYARALFTALVPLEKHWYAQIGANVTRDPELLALMRRSGCRGVFVGFESLSQQSLDSAAKGFNRADYYREAVRKFHERGIGVFAALALGFDHDTEDTFRKTAEFVQDAGVDALQLTILTPLPGTPLFDEMEREGRMVDRDWEHYDLGHVVFRPGSVSAEDLAAAHRSILRRFYSWRSIGRRLARQLRYLAAEQILLSLALSLGYRFKLRRLRYI
jgi:radical SAM superfamily enzyme YgiQ (UPF0313 family)